VLLKGDITILAPRKKVWDFLTDPNQIGPCAPGVEKIEVIEPNRKYHGTVSVGLGTVRARFTGVVEILEMDEPNHARLKAHGMASGSAADAVSEMALSDGPDGATNVHWTADVNVSGQLASLAARLMGPVSQKLAGQFYDEVRRRIETHEANIPYGRIRMRDIMPQLSRWYEEQKSIALATVVQTWGSAPRRAGARMAVTRDGKVVGSVSGGCVENAVIEAALDVLSTHQARLLHFSVADETAWTVGLACGGSIDILVKPIDPEFLESMQATLMNEQPAVAVTVIGGPPDMLGREVLIRDGVLPNGAFGKEWEPVVLKLATEVMSQRISRRVRLNESVEVFLERVAPPPSLIAVGGVHIAVAIVSLAKTLGYRTIIVDPRNAWANEERFPHVDQLVRAWPDDAFRVVPLLDSSAVVVLSHDPKLDDPALMTALASPAFYVGALGGKVTQAARRTRLLGAGLKEPQLARLHAPIGLDIRAESPEEIALAIMAEVVKTFRTQGSLLNVKRAIQDAP
jgi:xanthine dehydrogenase accessory factor